MTDLKMHTPNLTDANIAKLAELFPHCITESHDSKGNLIRAVDFDLLRQELSGVVVEGDQERYRLDWVGKKQAMLTANAPITKTLRPQREQSVDFDTTQNLFIEGDNLDALKLLQESYLDKVKMIYIDPPYNTGNDFIYKDNFAESTQTFLERSEQIDEEGNRLVANTESNGRYHSDWLSMMYSRLKLARNLLTDDGVIFISIDDNEQANLKRLCDEIFGAESFIAQISWRRQDGQTNIGQIARVKEYVFLYGKSNKVRLGRLPLSEKAKKDYQYQDERGYYGRGRLREPVRGRYNYDLKSPQGTTAQGPWLISLEEFQKLEKEDLIHWPENGGSPRRKIYLNDMLKKGQISNDFWNIEYGTNQRASLEVEKLLGGRYFDFPKPTSLLANILNIGLVDSNALILDFFAGSATTAHAVMQLNAEDGGNRRFIMVQLPEATDTKSEAYKAGYPTIAEISKERIRRAGVKIKAENADQAGIEQLDTGFRVLKVDDSNMQDVYYRPQDLTLDLVAQMVDHIKSDRSDEDLLFQVMLDLGLELSLPIECRQIDGQDVYFVADNSLVACFNNLSMAIIDEVATMQPLYFVSCERAIQQDHDKANFKERFGQLSHKTDVRFI